MNETIRLQQGAIFARAVAVDDLYLDGFHIPKNIFFIFLYILLLIFIFIYVYFYFWDIYF